MGRSREEREGRWWGCVEWLATFSFFLSSSVQLSGAVGCRQTLDALVSPTQTNATRLALCGYEGVYMQRNNIILCHYYYRWGRGLVQHLGRCTYFLSVQEWDKKISAWGLGSLLTQHVSNCYVDSVQRSKFTLQTRVNPSAQHFFVEHFVWKPYCDDMAQGSLCLAVARQERVTSHYSPKLPKTTNGSSLHFCFCLN